MDKHGMIPVYVAIIIGILMFVVIGVTVQSAPVSDSELTKDAVLPTLVSNEARLTDGEAIFVFNNPINNFNLQNVTFDFIKGRGNNVDKYELYYNVTEIYPYFNVTSNFINKTCNQLNNQTGNPETIDCSYTNSTSRWTNLTRQGWKIVDQPTFVDKGQYSIRIIVHWKAALGYQEIDWVPVVTFEKSKVGKSEDLKIKKPEWAWFNRSKSNNANFTFQFTNAPSKTNVTLTLNLSGTGYPVFNNSIDFTNSSHTATLGWWYYNNTCQLNDCYVKIRADTAVSSAATYTVVMYYNESPNEVSAVSRSNISRASLSGTIMTGDDFNYTAASVDTTNVYSTAGDPNLYWTKASGTGSLFMNFTTNGNALFSRYNLTGNVSIEIRMNESTAGNWVMFPSEPDLNSINGVQGDDMGDNANAFRIDLNGGNAPGGFVQAGTFSSDVWYRAEFVRAGVMDEVGTGSFPGNRTNGTWYSDNRVAQASFKGESKFAGGYYSTVINTAGFAQQDWVFVTVHYPYTPTVTFSSNSTNSSDVTDSCTYSSGNWLVTASDNCTILTDVVMGGGTNISITGSGSFTLKANVSNFTNMYIKTASVYQDPVFKGRFIWGKK